MQIPLFQCPLLEISDLWGFGVPRLCSRPGRLQTYTPSHISCEHPGLQRRLGNENSARSSSDRSFWTSLRAWTSAPILVIHVRGPQKWGVRSVMVGFGVFLLGGAPIFSGHRSPSAPKKNAKFYHDRFDPPFAAPLTWMSPPKCLFWESAPKYRTKGCSRYWRPEIRSLARECLKCCKTSVRAPGLSTDEREHPFCVILWGWLIFFFRV